MTGKKKRQSVPDDSAVSSKFRRGLGDQSPICSVEIGVKFQRRRNNMKITRRIVLAIWYAAFSI
jgi:hypothetical protein